MQKKIIALAVAGLVSGVAFAQSNVTIYGIADAYYVYSKGDNVNFSGVNSGGLSGGRLGFRGEEALGNGLKAVFNYEFGSLNIDQNDNNFGTRQSFVGLNGGFGTIAAGRQYAPSFNYLGGSSANGVTVVNPSNYFIPAFTTMQTGGGARWNNSIAYISPNWSGFEVQAIYGFGEEASNAKNSTTSDSARMGLGAKYANGPVYLTAIYQESKDASVVVLPADVGSKAWAVGGAYDFKVVKLLANYIQEKQDATDIKLKYWSAGVVVPVSAAGSVNLEYAQYKADGITDGKAKGLGLGYNHNLSKRTTAYVNVSHMRNDDGLRFGGQIGTGNGTTNVRGAATNDGVATLGESNTNFAVGVRHVF